MEVTFNLFDEIYKYLEWLNRRLSNYPYSKSTSVVTHNAISIINDAYKRVRNTRNTAVALIHDSMFNKAMKEHTAWQFSDYIWLFVKEQSLLLTQRKDFIETRNEKGNFKRNDEKFGFINDLRDMFSHLNLKSITLLSLFKNIQKFNKATASYIDKYNKIRTPLTMPMGMQFLKEYKKTVKLCYMKDELFNLSKKLNKPEKEYFVEISDIKNIPNDLTSEDNKINLSTVNFEYGDYTSTPSIFLNDVNDWIAVVQVSKRYAMRINMYELFYSMIVYTNDLIFTDNEKTKPEE